MCSTCFNRLLRIGVRVLVPLAGMGLLAFLGLLSRHLILGRLGRRAPSTPGRTRIEPLP